VPEVEGRLFGGTRQAAAAQTAPGSYAAQYPYAPSANAQSDPYAQAAAALEQSRQAQAGASPYTAQYPASQTAADRNAAFFNGINAAGTGAAGTAGAGGAIGPADGYFLGENSLWTGTFVPAVLETGVDTALPGNIIARVTENIYDSRSGKKLLLPQGTLLFARYNSEVSYSQSRVQIVWDSLIRPDGFYVELGGMPAVDSEGYSGQEGVYHENWFEYLKAAGLISMFSLANAKMTEEAAKHATEQGASNIAEANSRFVSQTGTAIVSRAMGIAPRITITRGTRLIVMLNKTVYFPPLPDIPAERKYRLK
jgi:hypothetical protein